MGKGKLRKVLVDNDRIEEIKRLGGGWV